MPSSFETEIHSLILTLRDPARVAAELVTRWGSQLLSEEEQEDCALFLLASGQLPVLFKQLGTTVKESGRIPWAQFSEAIGRVKVKPSRVEIDAILEGAKAQNALSDLVRSYQLDLWSRRFGELREQAETLRLNELEERKKELKDRLQFIRANRLYEEEAKALEEIESIFPSESEFAGERGSYEMRWAREIISRANRPDPVLDLERRANLLPSDQIASKDMMVVRARELAQADPKRVYDLALGLHFMDFHLEALEILEFGKDESTSGTLDWLRLDLMIHAHRFLDAIEEATRLESVHSNDPEAAFAVTYARARALKGLGQNVMAVDLLRSLVSVRPQYKSAQSLLTEWTGGEE